MNTNFITRLNQALAEEKQNRAYLNRASGYVKQAAQPPMDPAMMGGGGMPMDPAMMAGGGMPMDPAMMGGGGMPMDPAMMAGGGMPMDPAMMAGGGMPMDPSMMAPPPAPAPAPADTSSSSSKKVKPDEYMGRLDNRLYNVQVMLVAILKALNVPVPAEALIMPASGNEPDMDNPIPTLPEIGGGNDSLATGAPQDGAVAVPPPGGETPKTASYKTARYNDAEALRLRSLVDRLSDLQY